MNKYLLGGVVAATIATGALFFYNKDDLFPVSDSITQIIKDYQSFYDMIYDDAFVQEMTSLCEDTNTFNQKIQELKDSLASLKQRKLEYLTQAPEELREIEQKRQEKLARQKENIGAACAQDYNGQIMLPGSWELDFDFTPIPPHYRPKDANGKVVPPPGWPLDADGDPLPPGSLETPAGYAPDRTDEYLPDTTDPSIPPEIEEDKSEGETSTSKDPYEVIQENISNISFLEEMINTQISHLSSLCTTKKSSQQKQQKIPADCTSACQKVAQCSIVGGGTSEDQADDYTICMKECVARTKETKICINKYKPSDYQNCSRITLCIGQEQKYNKGMVPQGYDIDTLLEYQNK